MQIDFNKMDGLVPAIVQDGESGEVLMVAFMNAEAWQATVESGYATFYSRSRGKLWLKGESSGHRLRVLNALTDCDADAIVLKVQMEGPGVCHEGYRSCFFRSFDGSDWAITGDKSFNAEQVYR